MTAVAGAPRRRTALFDEHVALGADMSAYSWANMAMPWRYRTSLAEEQRAVRERAGLADVSQLRIVSVAGPGAAASLERLLPRRIADMPVGTSRFGVVLSRFGRICDEAMVLRLAPDAFWVSHGCGATRSQLAAVAEARGAGEVAIAHLDDVHVLSLQGPSSLRILAALAPRDAALEELPFLAHRRVTFGSAAALVSRTGFTGELGFEVFCAAADVVTLWRSLLSAGASSGLMPYAYQCVDLLRVEAGFTLFPNDLAVAASIWEANLGWLVRDKVDDDVGAAAVARARGAAATTRRFAGLRLGGERTVARGAPVQRGARDIGVVTSIAYSPAVDETLGLVHVDDDALAGGGLVSVAGASGELARLPFRARRGGTAPDSQVRRGPS